MNRPIRSRLKSNTTKIKNYLLKPTGIKPGKKIPRWAWAFWALPVLLVLTSYLLIFKDLPSPAKLAQYNIPISTKIYDRNGKLLFDIFADQNRSPVPLSEIPKNLQEATISIEDKNFYTHQGVNVIGGILRALATDITHGQLQGGSTITQQLVKSALLSPERTVTRKIKEIILAFWVEALYPKDKILELYLNQVPYGGTAWGVESASEQYFGKKVEDLTLAEAALLAGLPQAPTSYSPFGAHPDLAVTRQKEVLKRMVEDKYITQQQADQATAQPLVFKNETGIKAPHFVMYVREQLVQKYGEALVAKGGLKVTTTLDLNLQEYAQATVAAEVAKLKTYHVTNGAAIITKPATGEILAMVGSVDYFASPSGNYNVTTAARQPGSSIKPINYAIGLEKHIVTPSTMFIDEPTCFGVVGQPSYCPVNYDGKFHGPVQLRMALGNSFNIPAVKMLYINTVQDMVASASAFGITTFKDPSQYGLSLTLGGGEVHMTDMATAFGVFANGGIRHDLVSVLKVVDKNGKILEEYKDPNLGKDIPSQLLMNGPRVISAETAFLISHILLDNNARQQEFGSASELYIPNRAVSVKTGTTNDLRDNWTIGFTPQVLVATWVGNNDNSPMNPYLVSGITGAAPIWHKLMMQALKGKPDIWPKQPDGIVGAQICSITGLLPPNPDPNAGDKGCSTRFEYFIKGTIPTQWENLKQTVLIDKDTGDLVEPNKPNANVEMQDHQVISDGISRWCLDCPHPAGKSVFIK
ncbi:MAG: PBP1A family penicillin-binding protein [Candidatus Gottesmanbacteria bacterium]|nr:PBP1A family penicillin-binding protein [Candidatus Gottesmanbacteria bacterium]